MSRPRLEAWLMVLASLLFLGLFLLPVSRWYAPIARQCALLLSVAWMLWRLWVLERAWATYWAWTRNPSWILPVESLVTEGER